VALTRSAPALPRARAPAGAAAPVVAPASTGAAPVEDRAPARAASALAAARDLLALAKPRITAAVALSTAAGLALAPRPAGAGIAASCVAGTALMAAAACALNMWMERDIDARMSRTRARPLPGGRLPPGAALALAALLAPAGAALLAAGVGALHLALGTASLLLYAFVYTPLKRRTPWAFVAGLAPGALPALMGASAAGGALGPGGLALFGFVCAWQVPHTLALHAWQGAAYSAAGICPLGERLGPERLRRLAIASAALLAPLGALTARAADRGAAAALLALLAGAWFAAGARTTWRDPRDRDGARRFFRRSLAHLLAALGALAAL
jgi:protoheme IX farnesyltransferase